MSSENYRQLIRNLREGKHKKMHPLITETMRAISGNPIIKDSKPKRRKK